MRKELYFREAFETPKKAVSAIVMSGLTFLIFMLLVNPVYSYQMLTADPMNLPLVVSTMLADQTLRGYTGIAVTGLLAFLVGTVTIITAISLKKNYDSTESFTTTLGSVIDFASAGCASCGAGVLALMGVTGGAAVLPLQRPRSTGLEYTDPHRFHGVRRKEGQYLPDLSLGYILLLET